MKKDNFNLIEIKNLNIVFKNGEKYFHTIKKLNLNIKEGELLGIVGESGSGKTTLGKSILGLVNRKSGTINIDGNIVPRKRLTTINKSNFWLYNKGQMVFQNPLSSLPENKKVKSIILEGFKNFDVFSKLKKEYEENLKDKSFDDFNNNELKSLLNSYLKKDTKLSNISESINNTKIEMSKLNQINYEIEKISHFFKNKVALLKIQRKIEQDEILKEKLEIVKFIKETKKIFKNEIKLEVNEFYFKDRILKEIERILNETISHLKNKMLKAKLNKLNSQVFSYKEIEDLMKEISNKFKSSNIKGIEKDLFLNSFEYLKILFYIKEQMYTRSFKELVLEIFGKIWLSNKTSIFEIYDLKDKTKGNHSLIEEKEKYKAISSFIKDKLKLVNTFSLDLTNFLKVNSTESKFEVFNLIKNGILKILEVNDAISNYEYKEFKKILKSNKEKITSEYLSELDNSKSKLQEIGILNIKLEELTRKYTKRETEAKGEFQKTKEYVDFIKNNITSTEDSFTKELKLKKEEERKWQELKPKEFKDKLVMKKVESILSLLGLNTDSLNKYPKQFSGGQQQRIGIARSLLTNPKFIVADEPISALDVSVQSQIINLFKELHEKLNLTILFIAHDLEMVKYISQKMIVMYRGRIVEYGDTNKIYNNAIHPYTKALIKAIPKLDSINKKMEIDEYDEESHNYNKYTKVEYFEVEENHYVMGTSEEIKYWKKNKRT